jgi:CBS-domain-containing membrane protein
MTGEKRNGLFSRLRFDVKFRQRPLRYIIQCAIAGSVTMAFLVFLRLIEYTGIVAALGASTFMIFTMPHRVSTRARYVIGGYIMGTAAGICCNLLFIWPVAPFDRPGIFVLGAVAVTLASLLMVMTNSEHPPAAGLALGLVLQPWNAETVIFVIAAVCFLEIVKHFLKRFMVDLL